MNGSAPAIGALKREIIEYSRETKEYAVDEFGETMLRNLLAHREEADKMIEPNLKDWKLNRLPRVCRIVLELAVTEMMYGAEGTSIVINEAVEITKKFASDEDSHNHACRISRRITSR